MLLQALSLGHGVDVGKPRSGVVHSVFERAVNLLVDGELWTVLAGGWPDAPFGIRIARSLGGFNVISGDCVNVRAGFVGVENLIFDCRTAARWRPTPWAQPAGGLIARLAVMEH